MLVLEKWNKGTYHDRNPSRNSIKIFCFLQSYNRASLLHDLISSKICQGWWWISSGEQRETTQCIYFHLWGTYHSLHYSSKGSRDDKEIIRRWWCWWWWILFPNSLKIINSSVNWRLEERWEHSTLIIADIQFQNRDHKTSSSSSSSSLLSKEQQQSWEMTYEETRRCIIYSFFKTKTHTKQVLLPACCSHPNPRTNLSAAGRTQPKEEISSGGIINIIIVTIIIIIIRTKTTTTTHKLPIKDEQLQKTKPRQDKECNNNNNNKKQGLGLKAHGCFASKEK